MNVQSQEKKLHYEVHSLTLLPAEVTQRKGVRRASGFLKKDFFFKNIIFYYCVPEWVGGYDIGVVCDVETRT